MVTLHSSSEPHRRILRMYQSFFGRIPDVGGANYWIERYENGLSISSISRNFMFSDEFKAKYDGMYDMQFLKQVYRNVLGRQADIGGLNYWYGRMRDEGLERNRVIDFFSDSAEFRQRVPYHPSAFVQHVQAATSGDIEPVAPGVEWARWLNDDINVVFVDPSVAGDLDVTGGTRQRTVGYYGGVAAINGNWFGSYLPNWFSGLSISNGHALGSVNGDKRQGWIGEHRDGRWLYGAFNGNNVQPPGIEEAVTGLIMVQNGVINPYTTTITSDPTLTRRDPRSGIGLTGDGYFFMVTVNGRNYGRGMTGHEFANLLVQLGAKHALMLDGGGSSTLYIDGYGVVNQPSDGRPRQVSNQMRYLSEASWVS